MASIRTRTSKAEEVPVVEHDTYVFQVGRKWQWSCPCGVTSAGTFGRRMDADDDVWTHLDSLPHG